MSKSKIEWTDQTWNVTTGCTRVSSGCDNCYAVAMTKRLAGNELTMEKYSGLVNEGKNHFNGKIKLHEDELEKPLRWQKPRMVFVNSMSDLFHPDVPFEFIDKVFAVMAAAEKHTFQVLTKRPERMSQYLNRSNVFHSLNDASLSMDRGVVLPTQQHGMVPGKWPLPNVWLGTSVENQKAADQRIPHLLKCPGAVRFLSCEPLLGPVDLTEIPIKTPDPTINLYNCLTGAHFDEEYDNWIEEDKIFGTIDWVIVGGESGPNARPMHPDWPHTLRDQCQNAGVDFFFKQWGAWRSASRWTKDPWSKVSLVAPDGSWTPSNGQHMKSHCLLSQESGFEPMINVGKKKAGRHLDGCEYNQMPQLNTHN